MPGSGRVGSGEVKSFLKSRGSGQIGSSFPNATGRVRSGRVTIVLNLVGRIGSG